MTLTNEEKTFETPIEDFPEEVWDAGEEDINIKMNKLINKHVYLALKEYWAHHVCIDYPVILDNGHIALSISIGGDVDLQEYGKDFPEIIIDLESVFTKYDEEMLFYDTAANYKIAAESFERIAKHYRQRCKKIIQEEKIRISKRDIKEAMDIHKRQFEYTRDKSWGIIMAEEFGAVNPTD